MFTISMGALTLLISFCIYTTFLVAYFLKRLNNLEKDIKRMFKERDHSVDIIKDEVRNLNSLCERSEKLIVQEILFSRRRLRSQFRYAETPSPREIYFEDSEDEDVYSEISNDIERVFSNTLFGTQEDDENEDNSDK